MLAFSIISDASAFAFDSSFSKAILASSRASSAFLAALRPSEIFFSLSCIAAALEEARIAFEKELSNAKAEASEIIEKANNRATQIVSDATSKAETEAEKIITSANKTVENETNKAKEDLRKQLSSIIIDTTQKILDEEISKDKHEALLKKAAEEL